MGSFNVQVSKEILDVDESTNTGKLLASARFFLTQYHILNFIPARAIQLFPAQNTSFIFRYPNLVTASGARALSDRGVYGWWQWNEKKAKSQSMMH